MNVERCVFCPSPLQDNEQPKLLARFRVNTKDTLAVYKAISKEDFQDVVSLLPENTPLPASEKMTYLLARLEVRGCLQVVCVSYTALLFTCRSRAFVLLLLRWTVT